MCHCSVSSVFSANVAHDVEDGRRAEKYCRPHLRRISCSSRRSRSARRVARSDRRPRDRSARAGRGEARFPLSMDDPREVKPASRGNTAHRGSGTVGVTRNCARLLGGMALPKQDRKTCARRRALKTANTPPIPARLRHYRFLPARPRRIADNSCYARTRGPR